MSRLRLVLKRKGQVSRSDARQKRLDQTIIDDKPLLSNAPVVSSSKPKTRSVPSVAVGEPMQWNDTSARPPRSLPQTRPGDPIRQIRNGAGDPVLQTLHNSGKTQPWIQTAPVPSQEAIRGARPNGPLRTKLEKRRARLERLKGSGFDRLELLLSQDVTLVAIDTESTRRGLIDHITEVGISTFKPANVLNQDAGPFAEDWIAHVKHIHIVVNDGWNLLNLTERRRLRLLGLTWHWSSIGATRRSQFTSSIQLSSAQAKAKVREILQGLGDRNKSGNIALVGHSVIGDIVMLRKSVNLHLDLLDVNETGVPVAAFFDTHHLAKKAQLPVNSWTLSDVAKGAEIHPRYFTAFNSHARLTGWHNASNDAAYSMFVLLKLVAHRMGKTVGEPRQEMQIQSDAKTSPQSWGEWVRGIVQYLAAKRRR